MIQRGIQLVKEEVENEVQRRDSQLEYNEVKWLLFFKNMFFFH